MTLNPINALTHLFKLFGDHCECFEDGFYGPSDGDDSLWARTVWYVDFGAALQPYKTEHRNMQRADRQWKVNPVQWCTKVGIYTLSLLHSFINLSICSFLHPSVHPLPLHSSIHQLNLCIRLTAVIVSTLRPIMFLASIQWYGHSLARSVTKYI